MPDEDQKTPMRLWITKYALTQGVFEAEGFERGNDGWFRSSAPGTGLSQMFKLQVHAFADKSQALRKARLLRDAKIHALKRQIAQLQSIEFS